VSLSSTARLSPRDEAAALLCEVQAKALRGLLWAIVAYCPLQVLLWHRTPLAQRGWISLTFEALLLGGTGAQWLALRRLSLRGSGFLFVTWTAAIAMLGWVIAGPNMGIGIAMVCTILVAIFFVGKRAGASVLLGFGGFMLLHVWLHREGIFPATSAWPAARSTAVMLRLDVSAFAPLAICYVGVAMIHGALFRALARMAEEQQKRDLAEDARARAEETMRANQHFEALGKLTSGVAHDVNNSLTAILCNAELLLDDTPGPEQRLRLQDILGAARSAAQTTRQLLSLNRRAFCQPVSVDPVQVATAVTRLVGRLMPPNIAVRIEPRSSRRILVDPADLQQALLNLLLNSRDAMPHGGDITLAIVDLEPAPETLQPRVAISVRDTGRGIAPDVLPRIFDPFFTTKAPGKGTGLGLAMVKAFVEEAGGTVAAESEQGKGTRLTLTFPESRLPADADALLPGAALAGGQSILLIEDQEQLRALLARSLVRAGYRVTTAPDHAEALALLERGQTFDLLCTDGFTETTPVSQLIARHRASRPAAPVLLCSGHADDELLQGGLVHLRADLLRKPFTGAELIARVRQIFRAASRGQEVGARGETARPFA
jgi:signal transduction histidine kinase